MGNFQQAYKFGFGFDAKYAYNFSKAFAVTGSLGITNFSRKTHLLASGEPYEQIHNFSYVPLKFGARFSYRIFYFEPQAGIAFPVDNDASTSFMYAVQAGIVPFKNFDASIRFEGVTFSNGGNSYAPGGSDAGMFALRLAYALPFFQ